MKIDVLMPVYNEGSFIEAAVRSVLDHPIDRDLELRLIVIDDQSTDKTLEVLSALAAHYGGERLIIGSNEHKGKNNALNTAFNRSDGDYIVLMGGDDILVAETLRKRIEPLIAGAEVTTCKLRTFSDDPKYSGILIPKRGDRGALSGGTLAFDSEFASRFFPLPSDLPNEDTWIMLYVDMFCERLTHVEDVGLNYRIHPGNSLTRGLSWLNTRELRWERAVGIGHFYSRFKHQLTEKQRRRLATTLLLESSIRLGCGFSAALMPPMSFRDRISALVRGTRIGHFINYKVYRLIAGW